MYLHAPRAVREHIEYDRTADGLWRAAFKGAFDVFAEARSPEDARADVEEQIDKLVAKWIVCLPEPPRIRRGAGPESIARRKSTRPGRRRMP